MTTPELAPWLQRYFTEYLSAQRNVSHATITAYRDTFRLLLKHLRKTHRRCSHTQSLEILTSDTILRFLDDLEQKRGNSIRTRNARLAAIRSFVHYLSDWLGPELPVCVARILAIPLQATELRPAQWLPKHRPRHQPEFAQTISPHPKEGWIRA